MFLYTSFDLCKYYKMNIHTKTDDKEKEGMEEIMTLYNMSTQSCSMFRSVRAADGVRTTSYTCINNFLLSINLSRLVLFVKSGRNRRTLFIFRCTRVNTYLDIERNRDVLNMI